MEKTLKNTKQISFAEGAQDAHRAVARIARVRLVSGVITVEEFRASRRRQDQALADRLHHIITNIGA